VSAHVEVLLEGRAHCVARIADTNVFRAHSTPQESADQSPAHVAAADDGDSG
jgi:hypothetical protein